MTTATVGDGISLTLNLSQTAHDRLRKLAEATHRSEAEVVEEAVTALDDLRSWQEDAIREGVRQADAGEVEPWEDVAASLCLELSHLARGGRP